MIVTYGRSLQPREGTTVLDQINSGRPCSQILYMLLVFAIRYDHQLLRVGDLLRRIRCYWVSHTICKT